MHIYTYIYIDAYLYIYRHLHIHIYIYMQIYICTFSNSHIHIYIPVDFARRRNPMSPGFGAARGPPALERNPEAAPTSRCHFTCNDSATGNDM